MTNDPTTATPPTDPAPPPDVDAETIWRTLRRDLRAWLAARVDAGAETHDGFQQTLLADEAARVFAALPEASSTVIRLMRYAAREELRAIVATTRRRILVRPPQAFLQVPKPNPAQPPVINAVVPRRRDWAAFLESAGTVTIRLVDMKRPQLIAAMRRRSLNEKAHASYRLLYGELLARLDNDTVVLKDVWSVDEIDEQMFNIEQALGITE